MHIITTKTLRKWQAQHAQQASQLRAWYDVARRAKWGSLQESRQHFPQVDQLGSCLVFNMGRNFRLVAGVVWKSEMRRDGILFLKYFLTHRQYDSGTWKKDCEHDT